MKNNKTKSYPRFHRLIKCFACEVCEGEGTGEHPMRLVFYVYDEQGKMIGKIDTGDYETYEKRH